MISDRITIDPLVLGGLPCIRGMPVAVVSIVGMLRDHVSPEEILSDYSYLEPEDIEAAIAYVSKIESETGIRFRNMSPNHQRTLRRLRAMTPREKLDQVFKLNERNLRLFRIGLRRRHPDLSETDFEKLYLRIRAQWHNRND